LAGSTVKCRSIGCDRFPCTSFTVTTVLHDPWGLIPPI
jgi:hypothetical protein